MRETCKKEDIKAFLTLKIKKYYTLWKMADSFVKNISALFLQGFETGFKKTLERGKYMKKENGVAKQVGKKLNFWQKLWKYRVLTLMCVPAMIFFFAFNYMPLPGIYVAFVKYNYRDGIFGSKFVGLQNFEFLWESGKLLSLTKNTILYNLAFILLGNLLAVVVAILLNEMRCKWFKKVSQTMMFLPYFISQVLVGFLVFNYMPLPGIYVAFVKYNYRDGIFGSKFVGLQNFEFLWESGKLLSLTKNTILYNLAFILLGNLLAVVVAILLNEMRCKWFKKVSQTMMFLPYFISQVLVGFLVFNLLNYDTGFVNEILTRLGMEKWGPYSDPHVWPVLLVIIYLWQQTGYNSVVYFASICGIDAEMIEASKVDGANAFQRIRYILLPSLKPTVIILLLFALGGIVKGNFGLFYNIIGTNSLLYDTTDIIETFVYRATMTDFNFSTASAVGLYQSVVGFVIVMIVNYVVKKIEPDYSLF